MKDQPKVEQQEQNISLVQKSSKFKNAGRDIIHNSPHDNVGKANDIKNKHKEEEKLEEIIEEDIDATQRESLIGLPTDTKMPTISPNLHKTSKFDDSDGDGLLNWALNLPDEMNASHSSQFYKSGHR